MLTSQNRSQIEEEDAMHEYLIPMLENVLLVMGSSSGR